jgi:hypothetical protein
MARPPPTPGGNAKRDLELPETVRDSASSCQAFGFTLLKERLKGENAFTPAGYDEEAY